MEKFFRTVRASERLPQKKGWYFCLKDIEDGEKMHVVLYFFGNSFGDFPLEKIEWLEENEEK